MGGISMCTGIRFTDLSGNMYFGRNLDWTQSYGEKVVATPSSAIIPTAFDRPNDLKVGHTVIGIGIVVDNIPLIFRLRKRCWTRNCWIKFSTEHTLRRYRTKRFH